MLSDESSSDSETGRFKGQTKTEEDKSSDRKHDRFRSGRSRPSDDRFRRDFDRRRHDYDKHSTDRRRFSRNSPVRRRNSRDRSPRRSNERVRHRDARDTPKIKDHRGGSRDRQKRSQSHKSSEPRLRPHKSPELMLRSHRSPELKIRSHQSPEQKAKPLRLLEPKRDLKEEIKRSLEPRRDLKEEIKRTLEPRRDLKEEIKHTLEPRRDLKEEIKHSLEPVRRAPSKIDQKSPKSERRTSPKLDRQSREKVLSSPEYRGKKSEIYKPPIKAPLKRKSNSPVVVEVHSESDKSEEVQLGSYYKMIPAVVKEKSELSSEIDSSDDERLRAKLLNLEKELQKTRKKKHKKKHKRKTSKSSRDVDAPVIVEVSSTTDIQDKVKDYSSQNQAEAVPEVSSTQKITKKESSEEGEISSEDDDSRIEYDPSDLRHKLRRSKNDPSKPDICDPMLPSNLEGRRCRSSSQDIEGPALPPHLRSKPKSRHIGPYIPEEMRPVLADREVVKYESSDDDGIGPLPVGAEDKWSHAHQRLEERALDIKIRSIDGRSIDSQKVKSREEWMLALPEGKAKYLGLEARSFRAKAGPDMSDRSSWTDTPEDKARKAAGVVKEEDAEVVLLRESRARLIANRDDEQETAVKKHKKKHRREESLLEQHQKKLKKKKKKEEKDLDGKKERRPFSRDVDLQVNRFDEAQKKSIIKKAQDLNSRFGRGEAKYL